MHPDDAQRLQIEDGDIITVSSSAGEIRIAVELTDALMPRVISIPHGWGHDREGVRLEIAGQHAGVSLNDITDDAQIDELTGNAAFNGQLVTVSKVVQSDKVVRINDKRLVNERPQGS